MTKTIDVVRDKQDHGKRVAEEISERRAAIEKIREEKEKPRKDFLLTGKGDASEFFDVENFQPDIGEQAIKEFEEYSPSEREKFLRDGELIPAKAKEKAAEKKEEPQAAKPPERPKLADYRDAESGEIKHEDYEKALDKYEADKTAFDKQQAAQKNAEPKSEVSAETEPVDKELFAETEKESETWHSEPAHAEAMKTFPQRFQAMEAALTAEQKSAVVASQKAIGPIRADLNRFMLNALARTKNMSAVYVELLRQPALLWKINDDWERSANWQTSPDALKLRVSTDKAIRYMLKQFDRRAAAASGGGKATAQGGKVRDLTQAGRPPREPSSSSSSPTDDGSSDAAWRRKDLSPSERGELYRERKNQEEIDAKRKRYARPKR